MQWYADSLADLDEPTGTTKSNPGGTTDPTLAGTPDSYADCDGTNAVMFTPATPVNEVGAGDITIVLKFRMDTSTAGDILAQNYDGSGVADTAAGWSIVNATGTSRRIGLHAPPVVYTSERIDNESNAITLGQDAIAAFRRLSGTWSVWLAADAAGGMTVQTPVTNNLDGGTVFSECGDISIGAARDGATPFDGRIYWIVSFDAAISDADLQLADWDDEANLKAAWLSAGGTVTTSTLTSTVAVTDELVAILVGNIARILTDSINVTDGSVFSILRNQLLQDTLIVTDGDLQQFTTTNILADDTIAVVDSVLRYVQHNRTASDAIDITDSLISAIINYVILSRTLTSEIAVSDQLMTSVQRFIMLTDFLSVVDSATATYVPDPAGQVYEPFIRIGFDQPRIEVGGYGI